jgi:Nucleotidyl transferase AbiEii toxin, Type IV TA system
MTEWLKQTPERQGELLSLVSARTGLPAGAIEKDWWVTLALYAIFKTDWSDSLVFKGGTSLSKAWDIIERFSEDIDLVLDRSVLGFSGDLTKGQIRNLRKKSCEFTSGPFRENITAKLLEMGVPETSFKLTAREVKSSDTDPQVLILQYQSVVEKGDYLKGAVLIEVGARSLKEPAEMREITSIITGTLQDAKIAGEPFRVMTVLPSRTFLEKIFLLHEEFSRKEEKEIKDRMSRHLYDLERLMDTEHGKNALADSSLYITIIEHRAHYNAVRGLDYKEHHPEMINFVPPATVLYQWENDYKSMQENMIYGESLPFNKLISRMEELKARIREIKI